MHKENIVASLDVGTSMARVLIGTMQNSGKAKILGLGQSECSGLEQGAVVDISATEESIRKAVQDAQLTAGYRISSVYLGTGGGHVSGRSSQGGTAIKNREVSKTDVEEAIAAAKAMAFPRDEMLLHALPQSFSVDRQTRVRKPLGMSGERLDVQAYLISGLTNLLHNLQKCVARCQLGVERMIVEQIADSQAVLGLDELDAGVCLVNIGAGSTKIAVFRDGVPIFMATGDMGGSTVTNDLAAALRIPSRLAEEQKRRYGCAMAARVPEDNLVRFVRIDKREKQVVSGQTLASFIQPRYEEILNLVNEQITSQNVKEKISAGLVFVGGGGSIEGLTDLASEILHMTARRGNPMNIEDEPIIQGSPQWTTAVGLLLFGLREKMSARDEDGFFVNHSLSGKWIRFDRIYDWIGKNF